MDIYILYKSAYKSHNQTDLGIYQLKYCDEYVFEFIGECDSLTVQDIGGFEGIEFSQFDHTKIKKVDFDHDINKYVEVGE